MTGQLQAGATFTHLHFLDPKWTPAEGQRFKDGPKARMRVTAIMGGRVYYGYDDDATTVGSWTMPYAAFIATYLPRLNPPE